MTKAIDPDERAELISALLHTAEMVAGLLFVTERLADALEAGTRPSPQELQDLRGNMQLWREQLERLRQRLASMAVELPTKCSGDEIKRKNGD